MGNSWPKTTHPKTNQHQPRNPDKMGSKRAISLNQKQRNQRPPTPLKNQKPHANKSKKPQPRGRVNTVVIWTQKMMSGSLLPGVPNHMLGAREVAEVEVAEAVVAEATTEARTVRELRELREDQERKARKAREGGTRMGISQEVVEMAREVAREAVVKEVVEAEAVIEARSHGPLGKTVREEISPKVQTRVTSHNLVKVKLL